MKTSKHSSVIIVGGGIAGAATAYFLAQHGLHNIVILEKDQTVGAHSTGRNAAILRTLIPDPVLRDLARHAAEFYRRPPEGFSPHPLVDLVGVYLVAREQYASPLLACLDGSGGTYAPKRVDPEQLYGQIPLLAPGLTAALHQPFEGVFDVNEILQSFLRGACLKGAEIRTSCHAIGLRVRGGRVEGVETSGGFQSAECVVIAGGGWAAYLAADAGFPLPFHPFRRHLLVTEPQVQVDRRWPVVWILGDEFYFRPESGGLLMSGCDTTPVTPEQGEVTDPSQLESIAAKATQWLPYLADMRVARSWAGMRTFSADQRFVIGPDPRLQGLHWVAGLGGHGITCGPGVGEMAAAWIAEGQCLLPGATELLPDRLLK